LPELFTGSYSDLSNKPTLFSGSYADLTNKPTIPNNTSQLINGANFAPRSELTWSFITGKPAFATVATSGSYVDLTNKPIIPSAYTLPTATTTVLGGVKVDGTSITINGSGIISSTGGGGGAALPANALGFLYNTGDGTLSWGAPTLSTVSGDLVFDGGLIGPPVTGVGIGMYGDAPTPSTIGGEIRLQGGMSLVESGGPSTAGGNVLINAGQGSNEVEASAGGFVGIYGGPATRYGGEIRIEAGGTYGASGVGGDIIIQSGSSISGNAGNISIQSGVGSFGTLFEGVLSLRGKDVNLTSSNTGLKIKTGDVDFNDPAGPSVWEFDNLGNLKLPVGGDILNSSGQSVISASSSRTTASATTATIANNATANASITGFKAYALLKITTSAACWLRIYTDAASRSADSTRVQGVDPFPGSGVIAEIISTTAQTIIISPGTIGFNNEASPTTAIPVAITNLSGSSAAITATVTLLQLEA